MGVPRPNYAHGDKAISAKCRGIRVAEPAVLQLVREKVSRNPIWPSFGKIFAISNR